MPSFCLTKYHAHLALLPNLSPNDTASLVSFLIKYLPKLVPLVLPLISQACNVTLWLKLLKTDGPLCTRKYVGGPLVLQVKIVLLFCNRPSVGCEILIIVGAGVSAPIISTFPVTVQSQFVNLLSLFKSVAGSIARRSVPIRVYAGI